MSLDQLFGGNSRIKTVSIGFLQSLALVRPEIVFIFRRVCLDNWTPILEFS